MFERFTRTARQVVVGAQEEARSLGHGWIGTEHLLLAAVRQQEEPGAATLVRAGVTEEHCRAAVTRVVSSENGTLGPEDSEALKAFGIDLDEIRRRTDDAFGDGSLDAPAPRPAGRARGLLPFVRRRFPGSKASGEPPSQKGAASGHIRFTGRAKKALELSLREAIARRERHIGVEHVVLALLRSDDRISQGVFRQLGVSPGEMRDRVVAELRRAA
jgi:ATP-dependent Clp protease ATP-binding subunit ClpA